VPPSQCGEERLREAGKDLELAGDGCGGEEGAVGLGVSRRLGVRAQTRALAEVGARQLGAEAVGVVGERDELVRSEVDAGGRTTENVSRGN
jgi:hypothetical protein